MAEPNRVDALSRRTVLKGLAGAAGLVSVPAIIAACSSTPAATTAASAAAPSGAAPSAAPASAAPSAAESVATGTVSLGSNYSDAIPKGVLAGIIDTFTQQTGITVKINTVDHGTFQNQISSYLQGTPDDVRPAFEGYESNLNLFLRCGAIKEHPRKRPNFQQDAHPSACNNPKTRLPREGDGGNLRP